MAGQPPEPSWSPNGQDQTRIGWPQPGYTPPASPAAPQDTYAYPPSAQQAAGYGQQAQAAHAAGQQAPGQASGQAGPGQAGAGQGYPPPAYTSQDPSFAGLGYGQQGQAPGQAAPGWQAVAGMTNAARPKSHGDKGFIGSLFDFSFTSMVTPKVIKVIYILLTLWIALWAIIFLVLGFRTGGLAGGLFTLIVVEPIFVLLTLGMWRVVLEAFVILHRIYDETKKIREQGESKA